MSCVSWKSGFLWLGMTVNIVNLHTDGNPNLVPVAIKYDVLFSIQIQLVVQFNQFRYDQTTSSQRSCDMQEIIEGDIVMDNGFKKVVEYAMVDEGKLQQQKPKRQRRNAVVIDHHQKKWKHGIIPFAIDPSLGKVARKIIQLGIYQFHKNTCLWFTPRKNESDYLLFVRGEGCYSKVGRQGGEQIVSIGDECIRKSTIMHELMHAVGFYHENSRFDRDQYVKVLWWNIQSGKDKNFLTYSHGNIDGLQLPYDKHSLMHYNNKAFSKNYHDTLQALENPSESLGGQTMSKLDIKRVLIFYKCKKPKYRVRRGW
eukprot:gene7075-7872_t